MRREIFRYKLADGSERFADPLAIQRRLRTLLGKDPAAAVADMLDADPGKALPAALRLQWATCAAFDLGPPFDEKTGEGVVEAVWKPALFAFAEWWEKNASPASSLPTSSKPSPDSLLEPPAASSAAPGITRAA